MPRLSRLLRLTGRHRRSFPAALLLGVVLLLAGGGPIHLAVEALHEAHAQELQSGAVTTGTEVAAACPDGCADPHHAHLRHDHASCVTCRAFASPLVAAEGSACHAPGRSTVGLVGPDATPIGRDTHAASARGPPAALSLPRC